MFGGQFVFLFFAMQAGLPPGLTSVLVQLQGPLTVVLAALFLREHATRGQWLGLAVADGRRRADRAVGRRHGERLRRRPGAAVGADLGRRQPLLPLGARRVDVRRHRLGERAAAAAARAGRPGRSTGPAQLLAPILAPTWKGWFVLFYTVVPVMWLGYLIWGTLLRTYPAAKVGPISLLVPCVALVFAAGWSANRSAACGSWAWSSCWAAWRSGLFASTRRLR